MKFEMEVSYEQIRKRVLEAIQDLNYPPEPGVIDTLLWEDIADFESRLRAMEEEILNELVATREIGLGLGPGPGGGPYTYLLLNHITPEFVRDIISRDEGRSFYDLEPQCGGEAAELFLGAWRKAINEGLKKHLFFRYQHRYYTDEELYLQAKEKAAQRRVERAKIA